MSSSQQQQQPSVEKDKERMDAYEVVRVIGKGSFGLVTQIVRKSDGRALVWKEVNYGQMTEKEKQLIVTEVNILRELRHPHIVRYLDRVIDKAATKIYIVMEFCEGGDLSQYIKRKKREGTFIEESFIWQVFTHIYLALKECHRHRDGGVLRPILHRDIKPGNIFLDANNNAKLGDFGLAKELTSESKLAQTNVGTPYYMSPEMVNEMTYDERSDIWALGCLLYEMAMLAPPFDATNQLALAKKINAGKFQRIPAQYSESLFQAIRWMLHRHRARRPRVEDLERIPQLVQRLRAYGYATSSPLPQTPSNQSSEFQIQAKMKELLAFEENLQRQEAALMARERQLVEKEAEMNRRENEVKKREHFIELMSRKIYSANNGVRTLSPTTSEASNSSTENNQNNQNGGSNSPSLSDDYSSPHKLRGGMGRSNQVSNLEYPVAPPNRMSQPEADSPLMRPMPGGLRRMSGSESASPVTITSPRMNNPGGNHGGQRRMLFPTISDPPRGMSVGSSASTRPTTASSSISQYSQRGRDSCGSSSTYRSGDSRDHPRGLKEGSEKNVITMMKGMWTRS